MKLVAILPISVLLSGILWAQAPAGKPGSIQGLVINSLTSEPIKKAVVTLQGAAGPGPNSELPSSSVAMTGVSGQFHFDNVPPGSYMLSADRDGFKAEGQPHAPMAILKLITVTEEQHVQDVAIKLLPLGTVGGRVLDEDGDPIVRAQITVLRYSYGQGHKQLIQVAVTQANDLGEFDVLNLPPGRYCLQVVASLVRNIPPHTRWVHPEEAYPITFYPNASEARQATAIEVGPGAHVGNIDFRLRKLPS